MKRWNRGMRVMAGLSLAVAVAGTAEAARNGKNQKTNNNQNPRTQTVTQYVDTDVFTGAVQQVDTQLGQITVVGQVVQQQQKVQVAATASTQPIGQPSVTQTRRFTPATSCPFIVPNKPNATLASLKVGDPVKVQFRLTGSTSWSAVAITVTPPAAPAVAGNAG